jgi:hypothetical protein
MASAADAVTQIVPLGDGLLWRRRGGGQGEREPRASSRALHAGNVAPVSGDDGPAKRQTQTGASGVDFTAAALKFGE